MIIFLVQALLLVNSLMTAIRSWHGMYRDLREDRWCHACAELREAYLERDAAPVWRRVLLYPYYLYKIDGLRKEVRIFLLRERFVAPPAAAASLVDPSTAQPLSDMFNFSAYLRRRAADTAGEMLEMTPLTWFVVGFFLVAVIQVLVFLEFAAGRRGVTLPQTLPLPLPLPLLLHPPLLLTLTLTLPLPRISSRATSWRPCRGSCSCW